MNEIERKKIGFMEVTLTEYKGKQFELRIINNKTTSESFGSNYSKAYQNEDEAYQAFNLAVVAIKMTK